MQDVRVAGPTTLVIVALAAAASLSASALDSTVADWPYYGGDAGGTRYSPLGGIDRSNVARLQVAWEYHTGDVSEDRKSTRLNSSH